MNNLYNIDSPAYTVGMKVNGMTKLDLWVTPSDKSKLKAIAALEHTTMASLCRRIIRDYIERTPVAHIEDGRALG